MWPWRSTERNGGSLDDARDLKPGAPSTHRTGCWVRPVGDADSASSALLVGLRTPEADSQSVSPLGDIGHVESDQLAPAQCAVARVGGDLGHLDGLLSGVQQRQCPSLFLVCDQR
jgi:hypothetical protein